MMFVDENDTEEREELVLHGASAIVVVSAGDNWVERAKAEAAPTLLSFVYDGSGGPLWMCLDFLAACVNLRELVLRGVNVICQPEELVGALVKLKHLEVLDLMGSTVGHAVTELASSAHMWKGLRVVDLSACDLRGIDGLTLVLSMCKHPNWTMLHVAKNSLGAEGLSLMLAALRAHLPDGKACTITCVLNKSDKDQQDLLIFLHLRWLRSVACSRVVRDLLCFAKYGGVDRPLTKDVLNLIAKHVWNSRFSSAWPIDDTEDAPRPPIASSWQSRLCHLGPAKPESDSDE
jgi:hypothetical protein